MGFKFSKKINFDTFINNYTKESVYLLGLLWADGTVNKKNNMISLECIKEDIDYFYPIFQTTGEYGLYIRERKNRKVQGTIVGTSKELSDFLKENDYTKKSVLSPNKILSKIPDNLKFYFFLGWSDGDGCFYYHDVLKSSQYTMSGSYDQDWNVLEKISEELNIKYTIQRMVTKMNNKYSAFRITGIDDVIKFGNYIYHNRTIGLKRKYEKFNIISNHRNERFLMKILCYSLNNELIREFNSFKEISIWLNKDGNVYSNINGVCTGRQKTAFGFKWKKFKYQLNSKDSC